MKFLACIGILLASLGLCTLTAVQPPVGLLSEFWLVSAADEHGYSYWAASILHAKQENAGTRVRYFLIDGAVLPCNQPDVRAAEIFLSGKRIGDLTNEVNLCSLEATRIENAVSQSRRNPKLFESSRISITAKCGTARKSVQLPTFGIDEANFAKKIRSGKALLHLEQRLLDDLFGNIWGPTGEGNRAAMQKLGWDWSSELKRGDYDFGFWFCSGGQPTGLMTSVQPGALDITFGSDCDLQKFRQVIAAYHAPAIDMHGQHGRLAGIEGGRLLKYDDPVYSPLAIQARIEGEVSLELTVDRKTGSVMGVKPLAAHPLLEASSVNAARDWRFDPAQELKDIVVVKLQFSSPCAKKAAP